MNLGQNKGGDFHDLTIRIIPTWPKVYRGDLFGSGAPVYRGEIFIFVPIAGLLFGKSNFFGPGSQALVESGFFDVSKKFLDVFAYFRSFLLFSCGVLLY